MKAIVLVGGEGTRLRPLTETIPKPLLPFMNRPFLDQVLDHLGGHGVDEAILSSSYLESQFRGYLEGRSGGPRVTWMTEPEPLGTCGAIVGARRHLDGTFLVLNGDVLTDLDLTALVRFHGERSAVATISLTHVEDARPFGLVEREAGGRVLAFREKPPDPIPGDINAGTYVLEPQALDGVPENVMVSIERETFPSLIARGEPVYSLLSDDYWRDLGTPEAYLQAHLDGLAGRIGGPYPAPLVGPGAEVHPTAAVGPDVVLGERVRVGPEARVARSVVQDGCSIGNRASVTGSILGPSTEVEAGATVTGSVLAEGARVPADRSVAHAAVSAGQVAG
jgi:NDP-sugar pyrophosphorylase family protein